MAWLPWRISCFSLKKKAIRKIIKKWNSNSSSIFPFPRIVMSKSNAIATNYRKPLRLCNRISNFPHINYELKISSRKGLVRSLELLSVCLYENHKKRETHLDLLAKLVPFSKKEQIYVGLLWSILPSTIKVTHLKYNEVVEGTVLKLRTWPLVMIPIFPSI